MARRATRESNLSSLELPDLTGDEGLLSTGPRMLHEGSVQAIVGREAELEAVERFLDGVPSGPSPWLSRARPALARRRSGWRLSGLPRTGPTGCSRSVQRRARPSSPTLRSPTCSARRSTRRARRCPRRRSGRLRLPCCAPSRTSRPIRGRRRPGWSASWPRSPPTRRSSLRSTTSSGSMRPRLER